MCQDYLKYYVLYIEKHNTNQIFVCIQLIPLNYKYKLLSSHCYCMLHIAGCNFKLCTVLQNQVSLNFILPNKGTVSRDFRLLFVCSKDTAWALYEQAKTVS